MTQGKFKAICPGCGGRRWALLYDGKIRDGSYGKRTDEPARVYQCERCNLARLGEFVIRFEEYESTEYRERYNDTSDDLTILKMHDPEQGERIALIGIERLRDRIVVDYGCGHGALLDAMAGVARTSIGIEPFKAMHPSLKKRGHIVYGCAEEALSTYRGRVDVITSFGVVEHVDDPVSYLGNAFNLLADGGILIMQTDNLDDVLMKSGARGFAEFFYRTAHNWYFLPANLEALVKRCGFVDIETRTSHGYDFSNFLMWHKEGRPTGIGKLKLFDSVFEKLWKASIEGAGYGDLITLIGSKRLDESVAR